MVIISYASNQVVANEYFSYQDELSLVVIASVLLPAFLSAYFRLQEKILMMASV